MTAARRQEDQSLSRVPPHATNAEAAVLCACMHSREAFDETRDLLRPDRFYGEAHRQIYQAQCDLEAAGRPIDAVTVLEQLRATGRLEQVGGAAYLTQVVNAAEVLANARPYAQQVADAWRRRQVILACQRVVAEGYGGSVPVQDLANDAAQALSELAIEEGSTGFESMRVLLERNFKEIQSAADRGASIVGLSTGFDRYDRLTGGMHDGEVTIIAGRPGMGKTSLATNIAANVALSSLGLEVGIFSLEMPGEKLSARILSSESKTQYTRLQTGMLSPTDWQKIIGASKALSAVGLHIDGTPRLSVASLRAKARRLANECHRRGKRLALLVVDYLQLMAGDRTDSREQEVASVSRGLKQAAMEMKIPILVLSQLNRDVETRGEKSKRPQLSDLRESGSIEQDADNVVFVYRDQYYKKDTEHRNVAELIVAKQRNGATDTVRVRWDGEYTRFDNLADGEFEEYER